MKAIYVAEQFGETLGGRYIKEGDYSGEEFYLKLLYPTFCKAIFNREKILIDLTGCLGFPTSFLDESFGRLAREHEGFKLNNIIISMLEIHEQNRPDFIELEKIISYK